MSLGHQNSFVAFFCQHIMLRNILCLYCITGTINCSSKEIELNLCSHIKEAQIPQITTSLWSNNSIYVLVLIYIYAHVIWWQLHKSLHIWKFIFSSSPLLKNSPIMFWKLLMVKVFRWNSYRTWESWCSWSCGSLVVLYDSLINFHQKK